MFFSIKFFDDPKSFFHFILGFVLPFVPLPVVFAISFIYTAYQLLEKEPLPNKIGDFLELLIGALAGLTVKLLMRGVALFAR